MPFLYKPLWKTLIDNDMTKKQLMDNIKISKSTMDKMGRSENVSLDILDKICTYFNCSLGDVIEFRRNEEK
ncbi:MAG: helix-turn-helix transcriptional regulator [Clostridia bacterium]